MKTLKPANHYAPEPDPGMVFDLLVGPVRLAVLDAALQMDMTAILEKESSPKGIAEILHAENGTDNLVHFLDAMAAMGFAKKKDGEYTNTPFATTYLRKESPTYLGGMVQNLSHMQHRNLGRIPELIRQGPPEVKRQDRLDGEERWKQSVRHLASYQKAGMADFVADTVASLPEFATMRRMLDIGCGPGLMCMAVVKRHPVMQGVLCDLPPVLEVAREEITAAGLEDRISTIAGNYNEVDFGHDYDLIWASQTLYYIRDFAAMFSRLHDTLAPGGVFISFHEGLTCERTQPPGVVLSRLSLALEGQDVSFDQGQIAAYLPGAGFSSVEVHALDLPQGPMELIIARKGK